MFKKRKKLILFFFSGILLFLLLSFFYYFVGRNKKTVICRNCNVAIIDIDLLRADAIDCSNHFDRTPNICSIAKESVYFKNHISHSDLTAVSMVSAFTSLYPSSHNYWSKDISVYPDKATSLPQILNSAGNYVTAISEPGRNYSDFDRVQWFNWFETGINFDTLPDELNKIVRKNRNFFLLALDWELHAPYLRVKEKILSKGTKIPENIPLDRVEFDEVLSDYLARNFREVFREGVITDFPEAFTNPEINKKQLLKLFYRFDSLGPETLKYLKNSWPAKYNAYFSRVNPDNPEDIKFLRTLYYETLSQIDGELSELVYFLDKPGVKEKTIVIIRSEHGEEFYEHNKFSHSNYLYQELIHTPLIIRIPGIKATEISGLTEDIDLMPTILDLLGITPPQQTQGKSLVPLFKDPDAQIRDYQIAQKGDADFVTIFRKADWKLIIKENEPFELYDLFRDPSEKFNLIDSNKGLADELFYEYKDLIKNYPVYGNIYLAPPFEIEDKKRERLKEEGYF